MALSTHTRSGLQAASEDALAQLRHELVQLGQLGRGGVHRDHKLHGLHKVEAGKFIEILNKFLPCFCC